MSIFDLFSKRQKRLRGEVPDVYAYNQLPQPLRVQIVHIIRDTIGEDRYADYVGRAYKFINDALCREYGLFALTEHPYRSAKESVINYFLQCENVEQAFDVVELSFRVIDKFTREYDYQHETSRKLSADDAIEELNARFKEHGIGYQFESGEMIRVDSEYVHAEAIKPALSILREEIYKGANEEFLSAHEHYRHGRHKECLNEALKSFESVMKAICLKHKWPYSQSDTAKTLIDICLKNNLIPPYLQSQFTSLKSILESGVPTVRNKLGGHGQGADVVTVSESMARYALNLTAANILFLAAHEKDIWFFALRIVRHRPACQIIVRLPLLF